MNITNEQISYFFTSATNYFAEISKWGESVTKTEDKKA